MFTVWCHLLIPDGLARRGCAVVTGAGLSFVVTRREEVELLGIG